MINIKLQDIDMEYELKELLKLFTGEFAINGDQAQEDTVEIKVDFEGLKVNADYRNGQIWLEEKMDEKSYAENAKKESKRAVKVLAYKAMRTLLEKDLPWGILTGIRPTKIVHEMMGAGMDVESMKDELCDKYLLDEQKISLLIDIATTERKFIYPVDEKKISIYVSIPFCPTRCVYCSFPSHILSKWGHLMGDYLKALDFEIRETANIIKKKGLEIETVYIGGGTPTTLDAGELEFLIDSLKKNLDLSKIKEFTVEAGRPDTIDETKLKALRKMGIGRISINPQTMNDETLEKIGRSHTSKDIKDIYQMARELGFTNINMDLILGLPDETPEMVKNTLEEIKKLDPDSLTVHTMAIKRASKLNQCIEEYELSKYNDMVDMINISSRYAAEIGMKPYYMYRQKYMLGNLENIGYSKEGFECIYNMQIMEEKQSIIALGAGGISKVFYPAENRLERIPNVKNIEHYIPRVGEMVERKAKELLKEE